MPALIEKSGHFQYFSFSAPRHAVKLLDAVLQFLVNGTDGFLIILFIHADDDVQLRRALIDHADIDVRFRDGRKNTGIVDGRRS